MRYVDWPILTIGRNSFLLFSFPVCSIDLMEDEKLGYGFTSTDELEEIDIGPGDKLRPTSLVRNCIRLCES
jgi:hypothetical protein